MMAVVWRLLLLWINFSQVMALRCAQCVGNAASCRMTAKLCPSYETSCISIAYRTKDGSNTLMKGCSTPDICNQTSIIDTETHSIYMTSTCCETNYCNLNRYSTNQVFSNRLRCKTCESSGASCDAQSQSAIFCDEVNNNCVDIVTQDTMNGITTYSYTMGCGSANIGDACTNTYAFNTGNRTKYAYMACCNNIDGCNSGQQRIPILNNDNGIYCYGCLDTGNGECAEQNQQRVGCKGLMIRCMEAFDQNRRTIMKGCSTVPFCSSTYPSLQVPNIAEIQCCAGNMCNNFTRETSSTFSNSSSTGTSSGASTRDTSHFRLLVFFLSLLYAIANH